MTLMLIIGLSQSGVHTAIYEIKGNKAVIIIPVKAREYVFTSVGLCVCLSVTTITKTLWTDLHQILCEGS